MRSFGYLVRISCVVVLAALTVASVRAAQPHSADAHTVVLLRFDEQGTTAKDSSSLGNIGQLYKEPKILEQRGDPVDIHAREGKFKSCVRLEGVQWAEIRNSHSWVPDGQFTLEVWVNPKSGSRGWVVSNRAGGGRGFELYREADGRFSFLVETQIRRCELTSIQPLSVEQWHHVAGVYDGSRVALFVDGQLQGASCLSGSVKNLKDLCIGREQTEGANFFSGSVDDLRLSRIARPEYVGRIPAMQALEQQTTVAETSLIDRTPSAPADDRAFSVVLKCKPDQDLGELINTTSRHYPYGVRMYIPSGIYRTAKTIRPKAGDAVIGVHTGDQMGSEGTIFDYAGDGRAFDLEGTNSSRPLAHIEGIHLRNKGGGKYGIYGVLAARYLVLRDLIIDGFEIGMYLENTWINRFVGLTICNSKKTNLHLKGCNILGFYGCFFDGGNPSILVESCNTICFDSCDIESARGSRSIVVGDNAARITFRDCHFEDDGEVAWISASSSSGRTPVLGLRIEGCNMVGGSGESYIELGKNVIGTVILNNNFTGTAQTAIRITDPSVRDVAIGSNNVGRFVRKYIDNPHKVKVSPIGFMPEQEKPTPATAKTGK